MGVFRVDEKGEAMEVSSPLEKALLDVLYQREPLAIRAGIARLKEIMLEFPQADQPLEHEFADGLYKRTIFNRCGSLIVTKLHKEQNFTTVLSGRLAILTENGVHEVKGGDSWTTMPGTERVILALEDTYLSTVHPNPLNIRDLEVLEDRIIAKSWDEIEILGTTVPETLGGGQ
jgi:hypothetical protein